MICNCVDRERRGEGIEAFAGSEHIHAHVKPLFSHNRSFVPVTLPLALSLLSKVSISPSHAPSLASLPLLSLDILSSASLRLPFSVYLFRSLSWPYIVSFS